MQIQEHKQYQDAPDGLFLQYHNSRTQDTVVGPFGVHHLVTPTMPTGVVQRSLWPAGAACPLLMVIRAAFINRTRSVFVPSGV